MKRRSGQCLALNLDKMQARKLSLFVHFTDSSHQEDHSQDISQGYTLCKANPDLWYKPELRPDDGFRNYAYVLLYVDDFLSIHHDAEASFHQLDKLFQMKPGSIRDPDIYLGTLSHVL